MVKTEQQKFEEHLHYLKVFLENCVLIQPQITQAIRFVYDKLNNEWQERIQKGEFIARIN